MPQVDFWPLINECDELLKNFSLLNVDKAVQFSDKLHKLESEGVDFPSGLERRWLKLTEKLEEVRVAMKVK